ncbi:hypothetical protein ACJIZ3_011270 [Penstemon smallii]|uniref:GAG-pre-integrase domain-containing protein n=1 Tax=Penstemon smallii TaxID=265156 RepID=A0ABD3ULU6_9LAMI
MGNDGLAQVVGKGDVCFKINGSILILKDVRHAPYIRSNLISSRKLDDEGYCNTFHDGQWKLTKGSLVLVQGKKSSSLYFMQAPMYKYMVSVTDDDKITKLWHRRLSHLSEKRLGCLVKKNPLCGFKRAN